MVSALLVGAELVIGRTRRAEQHYVAAGPLRAAACSNARARSRSSSIGTPLPASAARSRGAVSPIRYTAVQRSPTRRRSGVKSEPFSLPPAIRWMPPAKRAQRDLGRRHVGRLGVVDIGDAADRPDLLEPVRHARRTSSAPRAPPRGPARARGRPRRPPSRSRGCAGRGSGCRPPPSAAPPRQNSVPSTWDEVGHPPRVRRDLSLAERHPGRLARRRPRARRPAGTTASVPGGWWAKIASLAAR